MLDYIVATDAHFQQRFASRSQRFFSFIQYYREKNALKASLAAVGVKDNAALRVEMNGEYVKMAESMSKEQVFKSIEKTVNDTPDFKKEKEALAREHQVVQDKKLAEKMQELEQIKTSGREPISIPELDARKEILGGDRVKPITPSAQKKKDIIKTQ